VVDRARIKTEANMGYRRGVERLPGGRYRVRRKIGGKVHKRTCSTRKLAEEFLKNLEREELRLPAAKRKTILEVATKYVNQAILLGRSSVTVRNHRETLARFGRFFSLEDAADLAQPDVDAYCAYRLEQESSGWKTVLNELKQLRAWLNAAEVPLRWKLPKPTLKETERTMPEDAETAAVYVALDPDLRLPFLLGLLTGMRPAEVWRVRWADVRGRVLTIRADKTGKLTPIWICETLLAAMGERGDAAAPVAGVTRLAMRGRFDRLSKRMGLPWNGLIHLRHTFSTWALEAGFPEAEVDGVLSHATRSVLRRHYDHQRPEVVAEHRRPLVEAVEARFLAALGTLGVHPNVAKRAEVLNFAPRVEDGIAS
jgi:integrase